MKKLLLVTLISLISFTVLSQSCLPEGITFTTQEQIDNFQTDHPGCTEIEGNVQIMGQDISNLDGLINITSIGGYLNVIDNPILSSLSGFMNLTYVGGGLYIGVVGYGSWGNPSLTNLSGLGNLSFIGGGLVICANDILINLNG